MSTVRVKVSTGVCAVSTVLVAGILTGYHSEAQQNRTDAADRPAASALAERVSTVGPAGADAGETELLGTLSAAGFCGQSLMTAWALVMRESGGDANIVSEPNQDGTRDYGLFQLNDVQRRDYDFSDVLTGEGNAEIAWRLSAGGTDFSSWGVGTTGWAGELRREHPRSWQQLNATLDQWRASYPGTDADSSNCRGAPAGLRR